MSKPSWLVVRGGLGNQMFQVAYGIALTQRYGVEMKYLNYCNNVRTKRDWGLGIFGIPQPKNSSLWNIASWYLIAVARRFKHLTGYPLPGFLIESIDRGAVRFPDTSPRIVDGFWQKEHYYRDHLPALRARFSVELGRYGCQLAQLRQLGRPIVALHARRGDYHSDSAAVRFQVCDVAYYRRAWESIKGELDHPILLVFSDERDWAISNLSFDAETQFSGIEEYQPGWVDMIRMRNCDHFIISNSSYSWWPAYLANDPHKRVVAPRYWFRKVPTERFGICPRSWSLT